MSEHSRRAGATDELRRLLRDDEELLWRGTPNRRRLMVDAVKAMTPVFVALGLIGVFVMFVAGLAVEASGRDPLSILPVLGVAAVVVAVVVVAVGLWYANRRHEYAEYAATDRRLISFGGCFGRDSSSVDWEGVRDLEATVGGVDRAFGTGTVHVATEGRGDITFRYVDRPHELAAALDRVRTGESQAMEFGDQPGAPESSVEASSPTGTAGGSRTGGAGETDNSAPDAGAGFEFGERRAGEDTGPAERVAGPDAEDVSETLEGLLRSGEKLQWHYRPPQRTYLRRTMVGSLLAGVIIWSLFYGLFVGGPVLAEFGPLVESLLGVPAVVAVAGGWVAVQVVWLVVMGLAAWNAKDRLEFAATDQRAIEVGGFVGLDTSAIEWSDVTDIEIKRNLMTKQFDTGSVRVQTGGGGVRFRPVVDPMPALETIEAIRRGEFTGEPVLVAGSGDDDALAGMEAQPTTVESLSRQARGMIRDEETLVWRGKPSVGPYVGPRLVGGLLLAGVGAVAAPFLGLFGMVLSLAGLGTAGKRALTYRNVEYVATDRRVLSFGGAVGRDSSSVDWSDVQDVEVDVGLVDGPFDTGTLRFSRAGRATPGERADAGGDGEEAFAGVQFERIPDAHRVAEVLERGRGPG